MNPVTRYKTERIDHLGIVAGICQEIGLIEEIDRQVGPSEQKVSVGQGTQAMVLNSLDFSSRATRREKLTSTPTFRWVFQTFEGIDILSVWVNGQPTLRQVLNLRPVHQQVIRLFNSQVRNCYFLNS